MHAAAKRLWAWPVSMVMVSGHACLAGRSRSRMLACFDSGTILQAAAKAARELPAGACVIDYTGSMQRMQPRVFTPLVQAEVPVSWHKAGHVLHACIKKL